MPLDELEALLDINVYDLDINTRALMATSSEGAYHMCQWSWTVIVNSDREQWWWTVIVNSDGEQWWFGCFLWSVFFSEDALIAKKCIDGEYSGDYSQEKVS